jgi:hypothetical protein
VGRDDGCVFLDWLRNLLPALRECVGNFYGDLQMKKETSGFSKNIRLVGWYWKTTNLHYLKDVSQWFYDDEKSEHIYKNLGVMCMDNFGNLVLVGKSYEHQSGDL